MIYLDSAATTLEKPAAVSRAVANAMKGCASPGRGGYQAANKANQVLFHCRELAAQLFDVSNPEQVILTHNATHGLNIAIRTLVKPGAKVVISGYEHNAVTRCLHSIPKLQIRIVRADPFDQGETLRKFESEIDDDVDAVICNHVSNVFGFIQPVEKIAALCRARGKPFVIDASQSAGMIPISMADLGAAFIAMPGHKGLYGPQGTGLLLCGGDVDPFIYGGTGSASLSQTMPEFLPDRLEAGTQNVCGAAGLLAGMEFVNRTGIRNIGRHESCLSRYTAKLLKEVANVRVFCGDNQSGVLSFVVDGIDCELIGDKLAEQGIAVRTGLHCAPLAHETVGTLESGTVRISFSAFNFKQQADYTVQAIKRIVA